MKKYFSIVFDALIIISSGLGIYFTFNHGGFMNNGTILYYTIQSNIYILLISLVLLILKVFKKKIPNWIYIIKFICTIGIIVTFLIFTFMLIPQMFGGFNEYLLSLSNLTLHFISPLLAVTSFILFDKIKVNKNTYLYGIIMPLVYCLFIFILTFIDKSSLFKGLGGKMERFPYFFMNYETNGWLRISSDIWELGFIYWFIIIFIVVILLSKILLKFVRIKNYGNHMVKE